MRSDGSGTSALYVILRTIYAGDGRNEVVLPAYTAPSLILPIRKAGYTPVLADVSPMSFNAEPTELLNRVGTRTKAVRLHIFGVPVQMSSLMDALRDSDVMCIEDACSAG